jgi:hypothetical protein
MSKDYIRIAGHDLVTGEPVTMEITRRLLEDGDKLKAAIACFMAMGWSEEEARKMLDDTLRDQPAQGSA